MLQEVLERRLPTLKVFSNAWTSQSGAENTNSIWQKLGVGASHSLAVVVDKVIAFLEREETRSKEKKNNKANLSALVSSFADRLSQKAFGMTLVQFNEGLNYDAIQQEADHIWLVLRKGLKEDKMFSPGQCVNWNLDGFARVTCQFISELRADTLYA